jgi:hypothetical protein
MTAILATHRLMFQPLRAKNRTMLATETRRACQGRLVKACGSVDM